MTAEQELNDTEAVTENRLIHFEPETKNKPRVHDINTKISALEQGLGQLNAELGSINASVEEGLDRLGDTDIDLTAKVSETYKRLGEIDNAYKALINISTKMDTALLKITQGVSDVAEQSANGLKNLAQTSVEKSNALAERNQHVVARVNSLVETSRTTNEQLKEGVRNNTENILSVEKKLIEEIEVLAKVTQCHADTADQEVVSNKARVLKLQKVDEAVMRRATVLEITSSELSAKTTKISASIQHLEDKSAYLTEKVVDLIVHVQTLQDKSDVHTGLIKGLKSNLSGLAESLLALTHLQRKHFRVMSAAFLVALFAIAGLYFYQHTALQKEAAQNTQRASNLSQKITTLRAQNSATSAGVSQLNSRVAMLDDNLKVNLNKLNQQVKQNLNHLNHKIAGMEDQVQSLGGRVNTRLMMADIGSDNMIHGKQWLAGQPADNFVIRLAAVTDKNKLYEIAQQYNYYLKDTLSYYTSTHNQRITYTLLYGSYTSQQQAMQALENLPRYIGLHQPDLGQFKYIQQL